MMHKHNCLVATSAYTCYEVQENNKVIYSEIQYFVTIKTFE